MSEGSRRGARERALGLLYESESKSVSVADALSVQPSTLDPYAEDLIRCIASRGGEIDDLIRKYAKGWDLERMPAVDRNVLRIGVAELLERIDVPIAVVISEAVELAKRYSTDDSGRFVNGLLAAVARKLR